MSDLGPIRRRIAARRAESGESAASFVPRSVLVVGDSAPHTRTVAREYRCLTCNDLLFHDDPPWCPACIGSAPVRVSPFVRRALAGKLPTHRDLPEEGGAL